MILQGMEDGAVDYVEGLQFFNAARRNGKQVILLSYPGEAHNLTNRDNQKDFSIRSEEHTSELQSPDHLVCRLLLEKKKTINERRAMISKSSTGLSRLSITANCAAKRVTAAACKTA